MMPEMTRHFVMEVANDIAKDAGQIQQMAVSLAQNNYGDETAHLNYQELLFLRYIVKQMELKVKLLSGYWESY
jgi:hypothetical protein